MTLNLKTLALATFASVLSIPALGMTAHAEDKRPCVSITEYRETTDVMKFRGVATPPPTRPQLENRWEVRHLGVLDTEVSDSRNTLWVYDICGYAHGDAEVWVVYTRYSGEAGLMSKWIRPGAIPNGSLYR